VTKNLLFITVGVLILIISIMGSGFYVLWIKVSPHDPQIEAQKKVGKEEGQDLVRPVYPLKSLIINLSDQGKTRYLKTSLDLELTNDETVTEIEKRLSQIKDTIFMIIPIKTSRDINCIEGKQALREEIMDKLNNILTEGCITNIFFAEFVIH